MWTNSRVFCLVLHIIRYASSFRDLLDVDRALSCSSLRDFEETLFCSSPRRQQGDRRPSVSALNSGLSSESTTPKGVAPSVAWALGERAYPATDWGGYWERNEPLRDADEVAVPVLCICSSDDPILPPASTIPLSLFQRNPYFLLVLTDRGGHCGFTLEGREDSKGGAEGTGDTVVQEGNWSHIAVLDYFRVVADFLEGEESNASSQGGPVGEHCQAGQRSRTSNLGPPRRRRTSGRRSKPPVTEESAEEGTFTWKRSYTR